MTSFERFTATETAASSLIGLSNRLATGEFYMTGSAKEPIAVEYAGKPETDWAERVDAIESDFAPQYDEEEYRNPALQMLNLAELDMLSRMMGVASPWDKSGGGKRLAETVLDIGCGTGRIAIFAAANGQAVTAFDQTAEYVEIAADKFRRIATKTDPKLLVAPVEDVVETDPTYDNITAMFAVLNHCEAWGDVVQRLPGKLNNGGKLGLSMYGSPDAAVFKAVEKGLPYKPGILVKRVTGGLLLGESADDVLPTAFPYPREVTARIEAGGVRVLEMLPMLPVTSLFPREPNSENVSSYLKSVRNIYGSVISTYLAQFQASSDQLLVASLCADYMVDADRINDAAYYGIVAQKEG